MIKPLAPRVLRGCSWTGLVLSFSLSLSLLLSPGLWAEAFAQQDNAKKKAENDAKPKPKDEDKDKDDPPAQAKVPVKPASTVEVLKDPKAEEALPLDKLKGVPGWRNVNESDVSAVKAMASGEQPV